MGEEVGFSLSVREEQNWADLKAAQHSALSRPFGADSASGHAI
jgi:hypothetical protein